jgi:RNase adaptor protein for sRNA GlmZ degradation
VIIVNEGTINTVGSYFATFYNTPNRSAFWKFTTNLLRLTEKISLLTCLRVFFLDADNSVLVKRWQARGYPPQLQPPFTYADYFAYSDALRTAKSLFERLSKIEVTEIDTASNSPSNVLQVMLNEFNIKQQ